MDIFIMLSLNKGKDEFFKAYKKGDEKRVEDGGNLLLEAVGLHKAEDRYEVSNFLLDRGSNASLITNDGNSAFHIMFSRREHDIKKTTALAKRLVEGGADINALDKKRMSALNWIKDSKYTDEELSELYDYWFTLPNQDFSVKNIMGYSVMDLAKKVPFRKDMVKRMKEYEKCN